MEDLHQALQGVLRGGRTSLSAQSSCNPSFNLPPSNRRAYLEFGDHRHFTELSGGLVLGILAREDVVEQRDVRLQKQAEELRRDRVLQHQMS